MDQYYIIVTYILAGLLGLCVGSFLNVVIYRVPNNMNLAKPASHCPKCGYVLRWYDNIPILSYLMLGGKCRSCKEHISIRYTLVEIEILKEIKNSNDNFRNFLEFLESKHHRIVRLKEVFEFLDLL